MRYEYVTVKTGRFIGAKCMEHKEIIDEYALKGFRYVGFIPTIMNDYGKIKELDLIFEIKE
ncbi:MAG: DUF4177 domain-containing protein [Lachnospiraceae bacterium]|nr:DUF4177 domain-containing protein [Lachnospiraceae bacterium]